MAGSPWFKGVVKEVVSGDTVVVMGAVKAGPPPEKRITLASLQAPRLARRDGSTQDEPFAWDSREFLRRRAIGQACSFRTEYVLEQAGGREFGSVFVGEGAAENLALSIAAAGWARVRGGGGKESPFIQALTAASAAAEAEGRGLFTKDAAAVAGAIRKSVDAGLDAESLLASVGKGKPLPAVVEAVLNGGTLRVTLLPDLQPATVHVVGVQAPAMGRRKQLPAENGAAGVEEEPPAPFAREAKHFTEVRALNREVRVVLEGVDKHGALFGTLMYPQGDAPVDLGEQLILNGYAKCAEWGLKMMVNGSFKLREAERKAKQAQLNIWRGYVPPPSAGAKLSDQFSGAVVEVISGDSLVVKDKALGQERQVTLSSIRAPRAGRREERPEPWAIEAKEFLRQRVVGQEVAVAMEYNRKLPPMEGAEGQLPERVLSFGSVLVREKDAKTGGSRQTNIAELLLLRGLATVVRHRSDEERSGHYEALMEAEAAGKKNKKGLHSGRDAPVHHVNDVSQQGSAAKARQFLPFLQRGKQTVVVERVLSGHRLLLHVPKEGVTIAFAPSGVRSPQRAQPARSGRPATQGEPHADEALAFTREAILQREVEIEVEAVDRAGTFLGTLRFTPAAGGAPQSFGVVLLKAGLAKLHPSFDAERVPGGRELAAAEAAAREARVKVWDGYVAPAAAASEEEGAAAENGIANGGGAAAEKLEVVVTEVVDGSSFYIQVAGEARVEWIEEQLKSLALEPPAQTLALSVGSLCLAKFTLDEQWYRARVEGMNRSDPVRPAYDVVFIDFGNRERLSGERVRPCDAALAAVPPQAQLCSLAYLKVPGLDSELGVEAARYLSQLVGGGRRLAATVKHQDRQPAGSTVGNKAVLLAEGEGGAGVSVNAEMLRAGLARLLRPKGKAAAEREATIAALAEAEEAARKAHEGLWVHGDPGNDSDDDALPPVKPVWGRR